MKFFVLFASFSVKFHPFRINFTIWYFFKIRIPSSTRFMKPISPIMIRCMNLDNLHVHWLPISEKDQSSKAAKFWKKTVSKIFSASKIKMNVSIMNTFRDKRTKWLKMDVDVVLRRTVLWSLIVNTRNVQIKPSIHGKAYTLW